MVLPASVKLLHGHGVTKDKAGRFYATYVPQNQSDPAARCLVRWEPDGSGAALLGDAALAQGVPHGLKYGVEADGTEYLLHANNAAKVIKTSLDGDVIWSTDMTAAWRNDKEHWPFKPTDLLVPPGTSSVFVADGYGLSKVHEFDMKTGTYTGVVFGGKGDSSGTWNCNHGLSWDDRVGKIVVSDRSNHRLTWINNDGTFVKTLNLTSNTPLPCNAQTSAGTVFGNEYLVVPGLGLDKVDPGPWLAGNVAIFDGNNTLVSNIEVAKLLGVDPTLPKNQQLGHTHPHDAIFLPNGDIVVAVWKGHEAGSLGGLEYWTHLKA